MERIALTVADRAIALGALVMLAGFTVGVLAALVARKRE